MKHFFSKKYVIALFGLFSLAIVTGLYYFSDFNESAYGEYAEHFEAGEEHEDPAERAKTQEQRQEYFFNMLRDPATNSIPRGIRAKELDFARKVDRGALLKSKTASDEITWTEVGPYDVGGRTRGIALDRRDPDVIVAGGASGGIWKSTDGGLSWDSKSEPDQNLGVSAVVQHPSNPDTWYYSTAEFFGSAGARGGGGDFYGSGIFKSTDNGENWFQLAGTADNDTGFSSQFDFISNIVISPTTGTMFFTSNAFGVFRSTDDALNTSLVLGQVNNHIYSDIAVTDDGTLYAVVSSPFSGVTSTSSPGVYMSTNDGLSWTDITPSGFPGTHYRSVIGVAPSNENIFYVFTDTGSGASGLTLFRFDVSNAPTIVSSERTDGIPNFGGDVGSLNPQGGYNLLVKVLPNDPDVVFLGGTNLFRSDDGFSGTVDENNVDKYWIGGYDTDNDISQYRNHHPDQHNLVFDPTDPKRAFSAHDGGISVTNDITAEPVAWITREEGYNVTQFYTVSIHPDADDPRIAGGAQDNGTLYFKYSLTGDHGVSTDESSGDGAFTYVGDNYLLTSAQNGFLLKQNYNFPTGSTFNWSYVAPLNANNQLFIHPFVVNPTNENFVFYPERNFLWRNNSMTTLTRNTSDPDGTTEGWEKLTSVSVGVNHSITALAFSSSSPSDRLYFGGISANFPPKIMRMDDITASDGEIDISIPQADSGAYVHDIVVNPEDGDEVLVVMSNYDVESVFHTDDAGATWTAVGGTLEGVNGPSVRAAAIAPTNNGTIYFVGTSTGLYSTTALNGNLTSWTPEALDVVGKAVIADLDYRAVDGVLAVGTHGRGMFIGQLNLGTANEANPLGDNPAQFRLNQNYPNPFNPSTNISFTLPQNSNVSLIIYTMSGQRVATLIDQDLMASGNHDLTFNADQLASGTYIYRLQATPQNGGSPINISKTMTLIK